MRLGSACVLVLLAVAASPPAAVAKPRMHDPVLLAAPAPTFAEWGGRYATPTGEQVTIRISDAYPQDPAMPARWAAFLGSLIHGAELSRVTLYLAPVNRVAGLCGSLAAAACYSASQSTIVASNEDFDDRTPAEAIVAHEYGHHIAASRRNPPWSAVDWGTKRWASYVGVCGKARAGTLFPGAESDPLQYRLNPGEAFAEAYRVLNERRLGRLESGWDVVSGSLYPDEIALALLEQDVVTPWRSNSTTVVRGSFSRRGRSATTHSIATPLDGSLRVNVSVARTQRLRFELRTASGLSVATRSVSGGRQTLSATVCGARSYRLRVTRLAGAGAYSATISRP